MSSYVTSFVGLFAGASEDDPGVERIEIPLIQRDYAQGRTDELTTRIRETFLDALHSATTDGERVGLDFIYGDLTAGTLRPLDGQQRLTTLFLLHWYVSSHTGRLNASDGWTQFAYATRPSARRFCERLVLHPLAEGQRPRAWIVDQPWYLHVWRHDPTVKSMLVMLDAIDRRFAGAELEGVWSRLVDPDEPAISFHLLPIDDMGSAEDLYIKMNSRGKLLTEFETFKAQLEKGLQHTPRAGELAALIDGKWADVMWPLRGDDNIFDEEFFNYIRFIVELCEWRNDASASPTDRDVARAERAFTVGQPGAEANIDFLFESFEAWIRSNTGEVEDFSALFDGLLSTASAQDAAAQGKVVVFGEVASSINLFEACCRTRSFGSRRSLFLYAVLLNRIHGTDDFVRRLRVLRNLIESSANEIRPNAMPRLIASVDELVRNGDLNLVDGFNAEQQRDEIRKRDFLAQNRRLEHEFFRLEDHPLLRGCLMAFDLDADVFEPRARAFRKLFGDARLLPELTGALLSAGDYRRHLTSGKYQLGSPKALSDWRDLLAPRAPSRDGLRPIREALGHLLDLVVASDLPHNERLREIQQQWLGERLSRALFDWRYYLVKYPAMREGASGIYATPGGEPSFSLCMLEGSAMNGYYRDAYLLALARECDAQDFVIGRIEHKADGPWFTGYAWEPRWMQLRASGVRMICAPDGFVVQAPPDGGRSESFEAVRLEHGLIDADEPGSYLLEVPQQLVRESRVDASDRVQMGAAFLATLVSAGL